MEKSLTMEPTPYFVTVTTSTFKFNAAHFVAFRGYRERLHGHNYRVGVRLLGQRQIGADGYVIDFGCVKQVCQKVCKQVNEHFLCPVHSNVLKITSYSEQQEQQQQSVRIECEDGSVFVFPQQDCAMLPLVHATAEELCIYLWGEILSGLNAGYLTQRGIHVMEITVAEAVGQEATFRLAIPTEADIVENKGNFHLDVRQYIMQGDIVPMPCTTEHPKACCPNCTASQVGAAFSEQLAVLASAINSGSLAEKQSVTVEDLMAYLS
jgi:dihydroneopterin triphosphate aldolase (PTPS-III) / 6-pyruvoyltetrahydropterin synthase